MNTTVTAEGMKVEAVASGNLLIGKTSVPSEIKVSFTETGTKPLVPCTYFAESELPASITTANADATAGYYQISNAGASVDSTGAASSSATYSAAVATGTTPNYIDYVVYIAAAETMPVSALAATITVSNAAGDVGNWTHQALTIDMKVAKAATTASNGVLADGITWDNIANATHITGVTVSSGETADHDGDDTVTSPKTAIIEVENILEDTSITSIGAVRSNDTLCVIMRVYFDGALQSDGNYLVRSANIEPDALDIKVEFAATPSAS